MPLICEGLTVHLVTEHLSVTTSEMSNFHQNTLCAFVSVFEQPVACRHETCSAIQKRSLQLYILEDNRAEQKHYTYMIHICLRDRGSVGIENSATRPARLNIVK